MVSKEPRFGGGIIMEHEKKQLTEVPSSAPVLKMEGINQRKPGTLPDLQGIDKKERENSHQADELSQQTKCGDKSTKQDDQDLLSNSVLNIDHYRDDFSEESKDSCVVKPRSPKADNGSPDVTQCSFLDPGQYRHEVDIGENETSQHKSSSLKYAQEDKTIGLTNTEASHVLSLSNKGNKGQGCLEECASPIREQLVRVEKLLNVFEILGIKRQLKLYSKLSEEEKNYWSPIFQQYLEDKFYPSVEVSENDTVLYCKNLFLKDRKGQFYKVIAEHSCNVDLKRLKQQLNAARNLSFATVDDMVNILQVKPGEVTPFTIMQESAKDVRVVVHESLYDVQKSNDIKLAFHPFSSLLQVDISFSELALFMNHSGKNLNILCYNDTSAKDKVSALLKDEQSATIFLKGEHSDLAPDNKSCNDKEVTALSKRGKRPQFLHVERKGKLKSYIKKSDRRISQNTQNDQNGSSNFSTLDEVQKVSNEKIPFKSVEKNTDAAEPKSYMKKLIEKSTNLQDIASTRTLPEINEFYNCLNQHKIDYRKINVSSETSEEIGPALGVRCYLLKDKRQNYFLIISHEFYELDYGRLKKCLHPKKKLEDCDISDLLVVLGVDSQHFTPFAFMNARARRNNVHVFFTQKITPGNIMLCVQHPFAKGNRILMQSSELQRLLVSFSSTSCLGEVEEKAWPKKYNRAFDQFDDISKQSQPNKRLLAATNSTKPVIVQGEKDRSTDKNYGSDVSFERQEVANRGVFNEIPQVNHNHPSNISSKTSTLGRFFRPNNCFSNVLDHTCQTLSHLWITQFGSFDCSTNNNFDVKESSVDGVTPAESSEISSLPMLKKSSTLVADNTRVDGVFENQQKIIEKLPLTPMEMSPDTFNKQVPSDNDDGGSSISLSKNITCDYISQSASVSPQSNSSFHNSYGLDIADFLINEIKQHLDLHNVNYVIKNCGDEFELDNLNDEDDFADPDDEERTSQICHTLHLTNGSGIENYLVVGRDSEHISVKRFRRRFQIENRLFIVNESQEDTPYGQNVRGLTRTNPFCSFISMMKPQKFENDKSNLAQNKCDMVLFSSIYMEPDMTCMFPLEGDDGSQLALCMSSRELESYAKCVGMDVWYMP